MDKVFFYALTATGFHEVVPVTVEGVVKMQQVFLVPGSAQNVVWWGMLQALDAQENRPYTI